MLFVFALACGSGGSAGDTSGPPSVPGLSGLEFVSTDHHGIRLTYEATLSFEDEEYAAASLGCNHLHAGYRIEDETLVLIDAISTDMGCGNKLMQQEGEVFRFLEGVPQLNWQYPELTLSTAETTIVFTDREFVFPDVPLEGR